MTGVRPIGTARHVTPERDAILKKRRGFLLAVCSLRSKLDNLGYAFGALLMPVVVMSVVVCCCLLLFIIIPPPVSHSFF